MSRELQCNFVKDMKFVDTFSDLNGKNKKIRMIEELANAGFGNNPIVSPLPHEPGILHIHLLNRCNLFCHHCYLCATPWHKTYLPIELIMHSLDDAKQLGIGTVHISGGEPFLYPELRKVLEYICLQHNLKLCVSTNGTMVGVREAELLKWTAPHFVYNQLSNFPT